MAQSFYLLFELFRTSQTFGSNTVLGKRRWRQPFVELSIYPTISWSLAASNRASRLREPSPLLAFEKIVLILTGLAQSVQCCTKKREIVGSIPKAEQKSGSKQGFWYFARSRTREIQVFLRNPAKFPKNYEIPRNPPEIFPNTCRQNIFNTYLGY